MAGIYRCMAMLLLLLFSSAARTQSRLIDSLKEQVHHAATSEQKLEAILALCNEYKSITRDTLDYYAFLARDLAAQTNKTRLKQMAELAVASDYARWGWTDSVVFTVDPVLAANQANDPEQRPLYFRAARLKAMAYAGRSRFREALSILYKVVDEAERYKDSLTLSENLNSIGSVALGRGNAGEAITWLSRALSASGDDKSFTEIKAAIFVNMADAYRLQGKTDSAILYSKKGVDIFAQTRNMTNLAIALQRQSSVFTEAGKLAEAEASLKEMIAVRQESGDGNMYSGDNISLAEFYVQTNQVRKAIAFCKNALMTGDVHTLLPGDNRSYANEITIRLEYYQVLARCYKILEDHAGYQEMLEHIIVAKDSLYEYNSAQAIAELQTQYEVQKKENTIIQQKLDITKKNNRFYTLLGVAFFLSVIAVVMFVDYRKRERLKLNAIVEKEKDLAARSIAKAEEDERKRIAADLHDNLGAYVASIVSNLDLIEPGGDDSPKGRAVRQLRSNSQEIVSQLNDTIWALKKDALSLTAISDRVKVFIQRLQHSYPGITVSVIEKIEQDLMLSPSHAFQLFRMMQEAINNALRHSRGTRVDVIVESRDGDWRILVTDDGVGLRQTIKEGNGLANMKERAAAAGWQVDWRSEEGSGTSVVISPATTN